MSHDKLHEKTIAYGLLRALLIVAGVVVLLWFLYEIQAILLYVGAGAAISLIGRPVVLFLKDKLKFGNNAAVITTLILFLIIIAAITYMTIPVILEQGQNLSKIDLEQVRNNLESLNTDISNYFNIDRVNLYESIQNVDYVRNFSLDRIPGFINDFLSIVGTILIAAFSIVFIAFFLLKDSRLLTEGVLVFARKSNEQKFVSAFESIKDLLSRYFVGLVFQVFIVFILYMIILFSLGLENAIIIALFCASLNLIPYLGPLIGYLIMMAFMISGNLGTDFQAVILPKLLWISFGYGFVQLLDNFVLQPLIFSKSVKSHPLEIFIIILIAGTLFGVLGLIFAIPTYTAIKVISKEFLSEYKIVQKLTKNL